MKMRKSKNNFFSHFQHHLVLIVFINLLFFSARLFQLLLRVDRLLMFMKMLKSSKQTHLALALDNCSICSLKSTTISWCFFLSKCAVSSDSKCTSSRSLRILINSPSRLRLTSTCGRESKLWVLVLFQWKNSVRALTWVKLPPSDSSKRSESEIIWTWSSDFSRSI